MLNAQSRVAEHKPWSWANNPAYTAKMAETALHRGEISVTPRHVSKYINLK
jgi:hypothetical protein